MIDRTCSAIEPPERQTGCRRYFHANWGLHYTFSSSQTLQKYKTTDSGKKMKQPTQLRKWNQNVANWFQARLVSISSSSAQLESTKKDGWKAGRQAGRQATHH
jgi:hypothetical protein